MPYSVYVGLLCCSFYDEWFGAVFRDQWLVPVGFSVALVYITLVIGSYSLLEYKVQLLLLPLAAYMYHSLFGSSVILIATRIPSVRLI